MRNIQPRANVGTPSRSGSEPVLLPGSSSRSTILFSGSLEIAQNQARLKATARAVLVKRSIQLQT